MVGYILCFAFGALFGFTVAAIMAVAKDEKEDHDSR